MSILEKILKEKALEVEERKKRIPHEELGAKKSEPVRAFVRSALESKPPVIIAEIKKASPSRGVIVSDFDAISIAKNYAANGAAALSVLTDEVFFQGSLLYVDSIKRAVELPVLRKDFIIDPYQVYESRVYGADAVLLIAECLGEGELIDLLILASQLQLTALIEVHEMDSLLKVRPHIGFPHAGYCLLGINNRDLRTMKTDLNHTLRLLGMVEDPSILVSESGIHSHEDVRRLQEAGIRSILVGEHLMKQPDVEQALRELIEEN